jgi:membrane associated rhomboid family serine protease
MLESLSDSLSTIVNQTHDHLPILGKICLVLWGAFIITLCSGRSLLLLGVRPRRLSGIPGIFLAPLLHADFNHLFFNTIPLLVLSNFILINGQAYYLQVTLLITLLSGTATWLFAKPGLHVGASGVITGYWSFLVCNMYQDFNATTLILGLVSVYYFAGLFLGIFPGEKGISWEGHLFGLLAGIATSYLMVLPTLH